MTSIGDGIYSANIPDNNNSLVFARMKDGSTSISWGDDLWNKTADLTLSGDNDLYTITGWGYDKVCPGAWSKYETSDPGEQGGDQPEDPQPATPKFYVTGDSALVVDAGYGVGKKWNADAIPSLTDTCTLNLKAGVAYKLKITVDGTWNTAKGYEDLTVVAEGLTQGGDGDDNNIGFTLKTAGKVRVIYTANMFKLKGNFSVPCNDVYGLLVNDQYVAGQRNTLQHEWVEYMLRNVHLSAGDNVQLYDYCHDAAWADPFEEGSYTFDIVDGKYVVAESGTYDFYLKFLGYGNNKVYIAKHGVYSSAVPSECEDVMMQAFYNESYSDNAPGASEYGNTRWATLLPQAEEISSYFDLVWLPPSAQGDGMGYHPKNYSNQNSNWGSRQELEALIAAFHGADEDTPNTKVVADIVINHCQSTSGWIGFPQFDFGEFGTFQPDGSYICGNDEVNTDPASTDQGAATGPYDDGENWQGARDWAHDAPKVQEMFKAYLKWMRKVMKYDGFRYDKGDGFNNWHHDNYNKAAGPYIAFMECYSGTDEIQGRISGANGNLMGLDFDLKWHVFNAIAGWDYSHGRGDCIMSRGDGRHSVTFMESHDWFLRPDNENEFGGRGNSMTEVMKPRLLQCNAFLLSMPGVPCIFYPHWAKYKQFIKPMIEARKLAGVHSESGVWDEYSTATGYQATVGGKYGYLILCLGDKCHGNFEGFEKKASYYSTCDGHDESYEIWVNRTAPLPTAIDNSTAMPEMTKFIENGQLFIRSGEKVYDLMGRKVK